jgi:hypothetical protein
MNARTWVVTGFVSAGVAVAAWVALTGSRTPDGGRKKTEAGYQWGENGEPPAEDRGAEIEVRVEGRATDAPGRYSQPEEPGAEAGVVEPAGDESTLMGGNTAATRPGGQALWGVGRFDGRPEHERDDRVEGEFAVLRAKTPVVTIRESSDFPQRIDAGQSFVIHLGDLPRAPLVLRVGLTTQAGDGRTFGPDTKARRLRILVNGQPVWRRWFVDGHAMLDVYVPSTCIESESNILVIENEGLQSVAFDALALERLVPGGPVLAALTGAQRLGGAQAADVPQTVLRLATPLGVPVQAAAATSAAVAAPRDLADAIRFWRAVAPTAPGMADEEGARRRAQWDEAVTAALRRGMMPIAEIDGSGEPADWAYYAQRYGGALQAWIVSSEDAARTLREWIPGARVYGRAWFLLAEPQGATTSEFDAIFFSTHTEAFGGRVDRRAGARRLQFLRAGMTPPELGGRFHPPASLGDISAQRRNALYVVWTTMQWWMTGGDSVVAQGGEIGSDFFPDVSGEPGPAWEAVRRLFSLGEGTPRRLPCAVVPAAGDEPLADSHWVAAENGPELVTALLMPGYPDRGRSVRLLLSVPWTGPTQGVIDGVRGLFNWQGGDPAPREPRAVGLTAAPSKPTAEDRLLEGARGHVELEVELDEFVRVRLWPTGRPPPERRRALERMPPERRAGPETVRGVFRVRRDPPPSGVRYEVLRAARYSAGPTGGAHTSEVRTATRGSFPSQRIDDTFAARGTVEVRNVAPWEEESLFVTFRPDEQAHGFRLFAAQHGWRGAWGIMMYARARLTDPPPVRPGVPPPKPPSFWFGTPVRRERIEVPLEQWVMITAPYEGFWRRGENEAHVHIWPDMGETRGVELEINGCTAIYLTDNERRELGVARAAMAWSEDGRKLWLLIESEPGRPAVWQGRMERPIRIAGARTVAPERLAGVRVRHRDVAQMLEVHLPLMPEFESGRPAEKVRALFPRLRPDPARSWVLIEIDVER